MARGLQSTTARVEFVLKGIVEMILKSKNQQRKLLVTTAVLFVSSVSFAGSMSQSWGHLSKYGVDAGKAWSVVKDKCATSGVTVAVVDTGVDSAHPDLKNSLWINEKEKNGLPGVDDDNNGFIDDVNGWDFVTRSGKIVDNNNHGTHIAGIIGAHAATANGYSGICPGVHVMSLRYYDKNASGVQNLKNTVRALEYAVSNGADIINYSGGGAEFSRAEMMALKKAEQKGILVVAAAGNERSNADVNLYFPAAYSLTNILSITAINVEGEVLPSSNWGVQKVQIAAPGNSILSTFPGGSYGTMTGTSQATAFVSGIAALMLSVNKDLSVADLKRRIVDTAIRHKQLVGKTQFGAAVNAYRAVLAAGNQEYKVREKPIQKTIKARSLAADKINIQPKPSSKLSASPSAKSFSGKKGSLLWDTILPRTDR